MSLDVSTGTKRQLISHYLFLSCLERTNKFQQLWFVLYRGFCLFLHNSQCIISITDPPTSAANDSSRKTVSTQFHIWIYIMCKEKLICSIFRVSAEELLLYSGRQRPHSHLRPHVNCFGKCLSLGISVFSVFFLHFNFVYLLTTKAYGSHASGDYGTSGHYDKYFK